MKMTEDQILSNIREFMRQVGITNKQLIHSNSNLKNDIGLDSLEIIELNIKLEDLTGKICNTPELFETVADIIEFFKEESI